jgi:hypothetical protein
MEVPGLVVCADRTVKNGIYVVSSDNVKACRAWRVVDDPGLASVDI